MPNGKRLKQIKGQTWQEGDIWISATDDLPLSNWGESDRESFDNIFCSIRAYLTACEKTGDYQEMIEHYNLRIKQKTPDKYNFYLESPV